MLRFNHTGSMVEKAAHRVMQTYLDHQRTAKAYKRHLKDLKDTKHLEDDLVFTQLRSDMNLAKENWLGAKLTLAAVKAAPPDEKRPL